MVQLSCMKNGFCETTGLVHAVSAHVTFCGRNYHIFFQLIDARQSDELKSRFLSSMSRHEQLMIEFWKSEYNMQN